MPPDREINSDNLLYVVGVHERRLGTLDTKLDGTASKEDVHDIRAGLDDLKSAVVRAALGFAGSMAVFSATIWLVFK